MIKLALADDQVLFRRGLSMLLRDMADVQVVFECGNGEELLLGLEGNPVDIVLLDLQMPVMDGKEAMTKIKAKHPEVKVIVLSSHDEEEFIVPMIELGAHGYMLKTAEPNEIENAIGSVSENGFYFSEAVNRVMLHGLVSKHNVKPTFPEIDPLSEREIEVIRGICQEMTTTEIAGSLFISPRTVEYHRNNILLKTGARNVAGLVVYALTKGIYSPE
jgi:DNA-binding NarL/FixJ family response regulator